MTSPVSWRESGDTPSPADFAAAAAWVARLHGPNRTVQVERGLRRWLDGAPAHRAAFEAMTAGWELTGRLPRTPFPHLSRWQRIGYRDGFIRSAAAVAAICLLVLGALFYLNRMEGVATGVGEQRLLTLDDGTHVFLNTDSRVVVKYDKSTRRVLLKSGEALFDVADRPNWPFIVEAADQQVRALGTSFIVREDAARLSVTLVEGKVSVSPVSLRSTTVSADSPAADQGGSAIAVTAEPLTLVPGQRVTLSAHHAPHVDQPDMEAVTAWRRGLVDFENTPLADAVAEMNRYSTVRLTLEGPSSAIRITGVFRAGDASSFAAALTRAYPLEAAEDKEGIRLTAAPQ